MDSTFTRRRLLRSVGLAGGVGLAGCSQLRPPSAGEETPDPRTTDASSTDRSPGGTVSPPTPGELPDSVGLEAVASGLQAPVAAAFPPGTDRSYVADQVGVVYVFESGTRRDRPFLDLRDSLEYGGEKGLLSIALHPEFAENRRLFVRYSAPRRSGTPSNYSHTFVLGEFRATADGLRAVADSERIVLEIPEPQSNHNAGDLAFGPDGYLYVAVGDGGASGDQGTGHVDDWYGAVDGGNGQDVTENLLGSVLRIDVDGEGSDGRAYAIPEDNPLVGRPGLDELYAWGLRNPWRMSFDGEDLYVGDVGQSAYEEVNLVASGGNYGWNVKEGTHCFRADDCPDATPSDVRGGGPLVDPIIEYPHSGGEVSGISVIGGFVYRGDAIAGLGGAYVFADLRANGRLFVATEPTAAGDLWPTRVLDVAGDDAKLERVLSFARDADGELYVLGTTSDGGGMYRLVQP